MPPIPFRYDPAWLSRIRAAGTRDANELARMHAAWIGGSLWARLGTAYLNRIYLGLLEDPDFIAFVYEEEGQVKGFIAGTQNGPGMMRRVFCRHGFSLAFAAVRQALKSPGIVRPLLQTPLYFIRSRPDPCLDVPAESLFCAFEPRLRGKRIAGLINKVLFDELLARGHKFVKITTESDNHAARRQLESWDFQDRGAFCFYEKEMTIFLLDLEKSEGVDPVRRHSRFNPA